MLLLLDKQRKLPMYRQRSARSLLPTLIYWPVRSFFFSINYVKGFVVDSVRTWGLGFIAAAIALFFGQHNSLNDILNPFASGDIWGYVLFAEGLFVVGLRVKYEQRVSRRKDRISYSREIDD